MENELNYISDQIAEKEQSRDSIEDMSRKSESISMREEYTRHIVRLNSEIDYLTNILNFITEHQLTS